MFTVEVMFTTTDECTTQSWSNRACINKILSQYLKLFQAIRNILLIGNVIATKAHPLLQHWWIFHCI